MYMSYRTRFIVILYILLRPDDTRTSVVYINVHYNKLSINLKTFKIIIIVHNIINYLKHSNILR